MSVLLIFIDGLGIGTRGTHNPLDKLEEGFDSQLLGIFRDEEPRLPFNGKRAVTDCLLGIDGLPQSATGQTTILTGVNAAALIGRHLNGYPSPRLRQTLAKQSIYRKLSERGRSATFANAYTPRFFSKRPRFVSVTTVAAETAGLKLRTLEDLTAGRAIYQDFTNRLLIERGYSLPVCEPEEAGERLAGLSAVHDFTLYEYFQTDRAGHQQNGSFANNILHSLSRFVRAALAASDLARNTVIVTSDHGNIEDLSTRSHTPNPVATLAFGSGKQLITSQVRSLTDITPLILQLLGEATANSSS